MTARHALVPARKRKQRPTTDASYAAMLIRMLRGQAKRAGGSREALAYVLAVEAEARDCANLALYMAHYRDGEPASLAAIGDVLGISKQAVAKRVNLGREVADRLEAQHGLTSRVERKAI